MAANQEKIALSAKELEWAKKLDAQIDRIKINKKELSEVAKANLKYLLKDLYQEVPAVLPHLYVLFKDCVDRIEHSNPISTYVFISILGNIKEIVQRVPVITSKDLTGRDRDWYPVEFCENFEAVNLKEVGIGKIYVNANGTYRVYEPNKEKKSIDSVCGGELPALPAGTHWKERLQKPQYQADVREAALNNDVFREGPLVVSDKLPSRVRVWGKIEEYSKIVNPNNKIDAAEQAENLLRRLCGLPLCVERERALVTVEEAKGKLAAAEKSFNKLKENTPHRFNIENEEDFPIEKKIFTYSTQLIECENDISALGAGTMVDDITLQSVVNLSDKVTGLSEHIDMLPFKKLNKAVIDLSKGVAPTPTQQIRLGDLKKRWNIIQAKLTPVMNENTWSKIDQLDIPYTLDAFESMVVSLENMLDERLAKDLNELSDDSESEESRQNIANILKLLPVFCKKRIDSVQQALEYFLDCMRSGRLDKKAIADADILQEFLVVLEDATNQAPNLPKIEKFTKKLMKKIEHIVADTAAKPGPMDQSPDDSKPISKKRKKKAKTDAGGDTPEKKSKWNIQYLFEDGGDTGIAAGGDILPPAPAPAPHLMGTRHNVQGQSPLWHALRELYFHLQKTEGYKDVSIPRLEQYLKLLEEISKNRDLTVRGKDLWATLNPEGAGFKAVQLLNPLLPDKRNILEKARDDHKDQYLPKFQSLLSVEGNKYDVGSCFYIEKISGILYLMRKDGTDPSAEELQNAFAKYQVICQDMEGSVDAKIYICNDPFTQKPENQEKIAAIVNCLDLNLATDDTVPDQNKAIQQAVQELSVKMKDPVSSTADVEVTDEKMLDGKLQDYRVTLTDGRCLLPASRLEDKPERIEYLSTVYTWEQRCKYLGAVSTVNRVLPEVKKDSYRKEKTLVYLDLLGEQAVKQLDEEMKRRTVQREEYCSRERQTQEALSFLQAAEENITDMGWLEKDNETAKAQALAIARTIAQDYKSSDAVAAEGSEDEALKAAYRNSLATYNEEQLLKMHRDKQLQYLEREYQFKFHDVAGDGSCFYHAVAYEMEQLGISAFKNDNEELHRSLRRRAQGEKFKDGVYTYAGEKQLVRLVQETHVPIAIIDTRYPELGFRCYFINKQGKIDATYDSSWFKWQAANDRTVIRLVFTGDYYMSVTQHGILPAGALGKEFNIAEEHQELQSGHASTVEQSQSRSNVDSEGQQLFHSQTQSNVVSSSSESVYSRVHTSQVSRRNLSQQGDASVSRSLASTSAVDPKKIAHPLTDTRYGIFNPSVILRSCREEVEKNSEQHSALSNLFNPGV